MDEPGGRLSVRVKSMGRIDGALEQLIFDHERLVGASYEGKTLDQFRAIASHFRSCRFENLTMRSACFGGGRHQSLYEGCSFDGSTIISGAPGVARFVGCTFRNASISEFFGQSVSMVDCVFSGTLNKVAFYGVDPVNGRWFWRRRNEFRGNDFRDARLLDVSFREGIDLALQRFPPGWSLPDDPYNRAVT